MWTTFLNEAPRMGAKGLASIKKYECKCDRVHSESEKKCRSSKNYRTQNVPQRYLHKPKITFRIKPTTRPICMRRLHSARKSLSAEHIKWGERDVRKHGALWRLESVPTLPESGGFWRT